MFQQRLQFFVMAALALASSATTLMPISPPTQESLLQHAQETIWHRELQAASDFVSRRRRRRQRKRQLRRLHHERSLERYNDYLPEDAPDSLLYLSEEDSNNNNDIAGESGVSKGSRCLSPLQKWFVSLIESIGIDRWEEINSYNVTSLAYLYKHHVSGADGSNEYFGTYGEKTAEMVRNHESLTEFWSTTSTGDDASSNNNNVLLLGMHGVDLAENNHLIPTLQQIYRMEAVDAYALASKIQSLVQALPGAFNNPVLTANAIAIQSLNPDGSKSERDSIIVGDGVFQFLEWLKLGEDGPDYIHSHEYGHHLQYELGIEIDVDAASAGAGGVGPSISEQTRRWEMMADAFGSYYLAHATGGRTDARRLLEVHRAAFSLGDCEDAKGTHHGTPRQRECASNFGANLALASYMDNGYRIPPNEFKRKFDEDYDMMLVLDEEHCEPVVDASLLDKAIYGEVVQSSAASSGGGSVGSGTNNNETPQISTQDLNLETPSLTIPVSSPTDAYQPYSGYIPDDPHNSWSYGSDTFQAYDPSEWEGSSTENELDKPPPRVQNTNITVEEGEKGWFSGDSQWRTVGRSSANYSSGSAGSAMFVVAILSQMLLS